MYVSGGYFMYIRRECGKQVALDIVLWQGLWILATFMSFGALTRGRDVIVNASKVARRLDYTTISRMTGS